MNKRDFLKIILNASSLIFLSAFPSLAKSHKKNKDENPKTKGTKKREYFIENIYPNLTIESAEHQKLEGFVQPNKIS